MSPSDLRRASERHLNMMLGLVEEAAPHMQGWIRRTGSSGLKTSTRTSWPRWIGA